jgi:RelA/SpoT family (p)ppGpp synthetase
MQTLGVVSPEKRRRVAHETLEIYTPLANRFGMHKLRVQLEDLCFSALYPGRGKTLAQNVKKLRGNRKEVVRVIEKAIENACGLHNLEHLQVSGREKHLYSIYRKMRDRNLSLSEIMDVYAFRIIVDNIEDCYRVLGYVHNIYKPVPERFKDYIAIPKANGYQSLHTTLFGPYGVPIEIQIRTQKMHQMAENGIAAHWLYKSDSVSMNTDTQIRAQAWVKNLVEMQKSSANPLEFVENVKIDLFPDEVYVFTPKGSILELPRGATPVDFAYAVHSDVGNTCVAAKVDRQYTLLSRPLSNGQTVEVICALNAKPNPGWLDFAITGKARSSIRHYFKRKRSNESIDLGKILLTKALKKISLI